MRTMERVSLWESTASLLTWSSVGAVFLLTLDLAFEFPRTGGGGYVAAREGFFLEPDDASIDRSAARGCISVLERKLTI